MDRDNQNLLIATPSLSVISRYTTNGTESTGKIFSLAETKFIMPNENFYSYTEILAKDISYSLTGIGRRRIQLQNHNVLFGKIDKSMFWVKIELVESNCKYPLIFFSRSKNLKLVFSEIVQGVFLFGSPESRFSHFTGIFKSQVVLPLNQGILYQNPFIQRDQPSNDQEGRFFYIICPYFSFDKPVLDLYLEIDPVAIKHLRLPTSLTELQKDKMTQQEINDHYDQVITFFDQEIYKNQKILIQDIKQDKNGQKIKPYILDKQKVTEHKSNLQLGNLGNT